MLHLAQNTPAGGTRLLHPRNVTLLNHHFAKEPTETLLDYALSGALGEVALVSSFGAEAAVLLHLAATLDPAVPVLFLDTALLFPETLSYQRDLAAQLGLTNVRVLRARTSKRDPDDTLHRRDPDACCAMRKVAPLEKALASYDGWITGRKRFQSGARTALALFETDRTNGKVKVNPLANWSRDRIRAHFERHGLPPHPLIARGYASIGCAPCTTPVASHEDPRAGRWRDSNKQECGIHFANGRAERITG